jgi:hypothetical protein
MGSQGRQPAAVKKEWFMKERLMNLHSMQSLFFLSKSQKRDSSGVHISERNGFRKFTLRKLNVSC